MLIVCFGNVISYDVVLFSWLQVLELYAVVLVSWHPEPIYRYGEASDFCTYVTKEVVIWLTRIEGLFLLDRVNGRLTVKSDGDGSSVYVVFFVGGSDDEEAARNSGQLALICALSIARAWNGVDRDYTVFGTTKNGAGGAVA